MIACGKKETAPQAAQEQSAEGPAKEQAANKASPQPELAAADRLQKDHALDSPRSHSEAVVDVFGSKPFAALFIGRKSVRLGGKVVAKTRCLKAGRPCGPSDATGPVADVRIDIEPGELEAVDGAMQIRSVAKAARVLKDRAVAVIADRRITVSALGQAIAALRSAGARPVLAGVNGQGGVVIAAAQTVSGEEPGRHARAPDARGLPEHVVAIDLNVRDDGSEAVLRRSDKAGDDQRARLHGDRKTAVTRWADRIGRVYPTVRTITAAFAANTPWVDAIGTVDMLRDRCGTGSTRAVCKQRRRRFEAVRVAALPEAEAPTPQPPPIVDPQVVEPHAVLKSLGGSLTDPRASLNPPGPIPHDLLRIPVRPPGTIESAPGIVPPHVGGPPPAP